MTARLDTDRETVRPRFVESAISTTYWCREEDLDIEYSLVCQ